jgi:diphosphomevalonate decarboxylase
MGKEPDENRPLNPSLSYTLNHLCSRVELREHRHTCWRPLDHNITLSDTGQKRFLQHFEFLKIHWAIDGEFEIASTNNFPSDCGLASSASSFAALTRATAHLAESRGQKNSSRTDTDLSKLSQKGSGSSCRSFFSPWALWRESGVVAADLPAIDFHHHVVVVKKEKKTVSSSEAHRRVLTSSLFSQRADRAQRRLVELCQALQEQNVQHAFEICWTEFWDMHALFETSRPSFGYMTADSLQVLQWVRETFQKHNQAPLTTMDAGANVHLLFWPQQEHLVDQLKDVFGDKVI